MPTAHPTTPRSQRLEGTFYAPLFSPRGELEGATLDTAEGPAQVVFEPRDPDATELFTRLSAGDPLVLEVTSEKRADRQGHHAVFRLEHVPSAAARPTTFAGVVERVHYARHGEPNGVVLDTGTFLHLKPDGMEAHAPVPGDRLVATGRSRPLVTGHGVVVEVETLNGAKLRPKPRH